MVAVARRLGKGGCSAVKMEPDRNGTYIRWVVIAGLLAALVVGLTVRVRSADRMLAQARVHLSEERFTTAEQAALVVIARFRLRSTRAMEVLAEVHRARDAAGARMAAERALRTERALDEQAERIAVLAQRVGGLEAITLRSATLSERVGERLVEAEVHRARDVAGARVAAERALDEQTERITVLPQRVGGLEAITLRSAALSERVGERLDEIAARGPTMGEPPVSPDRANEAEALAAAGIDHYRAQRFMRAEATLRRALQTDPHNDRARVYLAAAVYRTDPLDAKRRRAAIGLLQDVAATGDTAVMARHTLGAIYDQEGVRERAIEAYSAALALRPDHIPSNRALGRLVFEPGRFDAAEEHWKRAMARLPGSEEVRFDLLRLAIARERWAEALEHGERLAASGSRLPAVYALVGRAKRALGDCDGAVVAWERAYRLNRHWRYLERSAVCSADTGDRRAAVEYYLRAVAEHPKNSSEARGEAYRLVERAVTVLWEVEPNRRTLQAAQRGMELLGNDPRAQMLVGDVHERLRQQRRAAEVYRDLIESERPVEGVYLALGRVYLALDEDTRRARRVLGDARRAGSEREYRRLQRLIEEYGDE